MKLSFVSKITLFSAVMLLTLSGMIGLSVWSMNQLASTFHEVSEVNLPAVRQITLADMYHDGVEGTVYRSLAGALSKDARLVEESVKKLTEYKASINECLDTLAGLPLREKAKANLKPVRLAFSNYVQKADEVVELTSAGKITEAQLRLADFDQQFEKLKTQMESFAEEVEADVRIIASRGQQIEARSQTFGWLSLLGGTAIGIAVSAWTIFDLRRKMKTLLQELSKEAEILQHSSGSVQRASRELSVVTSQQSAAIEETVASMEEMSSMLAQTTQQANRNLEISEDGQADASKGRAVMAKMAAAMDEIHASNQKLDGMVRVIGEIREKTNVINEIVAETRLLSFNASIEAARAGVHGKGFAVVAEEVGKLAAMSGKAASDIRELLETSNAEVTQIVRDNQERVLVGKRISDECEAMFNSMKDSLEKIGKGIQVITSATREQETGIKQTNKAMNDMSTSTQSNLQSVEALSLQSAKLATGSQSLYRTVDVMRRVMIGQAASKRQTVGTKEDARGLPFSPKTHSGSAPDSKEQRQSAA